MAINKSETKHLRGIYTEFRHNKIENYLRIAVEYEGAELYFYKLKSFEEWLQEVNELHKLIVQEVK